MQGTKIKDWETTMSRWPVAWLSVALVSSACGCGTAMNLTKGVMVPIRFAPYQRLYGGTQLDLELAAHELASPSNAEKETRLEEQLESWWYLICLGIDVPLSVLGD